jgi:hypothetical protein
MDIHNQIEVINSTMVAAGENFLPIHNDNLAAFTKELSHYINHLINTDFERLVSLLYRIDVDENKIKTLLETNAISSDIIAQQIIERQLQKIKTREMFKKDGEFGEDEKW